MKSITGGNSLDGRRLVSPEFHANIFQSRCIPRVNLFKDTGTYVNIWFQSNTTSIERTLAFSLCTPHECLRLASYCSIRMNFNEINCDRTGTRIVCVRSQQEFGPGEVHSFTSYGKVKIGPPTMHFIATKWKWFDTYWKLQPKWHKQRIRNFV